MLLGNHYVVPGWTLRKARIAYWDRFGHPDPLPEIRSASRPSGGGTPTRRRRRERRNELRPTGLTRRDGAQARRRERCRCAALPPFAWAAGKSGLHGLSIFGDLKYPAGFTHFDYVNAHAPKGGRMNFQPPNWIYNQSPQTFNTLNSFVLKGDSPPRMELIFDTLMTRGRRRARLRSTGCSPRPSTSPTTATSTPSTLRDGARFHDGSPLTADDVAFSLMLLKEKGHPNIAAGRSRRW